MLTKSFFWSALIATILVAATTMNAAAITTQQDSQFQDEDEEATLNFSGVIFDFGAIARSVHAVQRRQVELPDDNNLAGGEDNGVAPQQPVFRLQSAAAGEIPTPTRFIKTVMNSGLRR